MISVPLLFHVCFSVAAAVDFKRRLSFGLCVLPISAIGELLRFWDFCGQFSKTLNLPSTSLGHLLASLVVCTCFFFVFFFFHGTCVLSLPVLLFRRIDACLSACPLFFFFSAKNTMSCVEIPDSKKGVLS